MAKYISAKPTDTFINLDFGWIWLQDLSQGIVKNNVFCCQIVPKSPQTNPTAVITIVPSTSRSGNEHVT